MTTISKYILDSAKHHVIHDWRYRKMDMWEVLWKLFGIRKPKECYKMCRADIAKMPRNFEWIMGRK